MAESDATPTPDAATPTPDESAAGPRSTAETPPKPHVDEYGRPMKKPRTDRKRPARKSSKKRSGKSGGRRSLRAPLTQAVTMIGVGVTVADPYSGAVIAAQAEQVATQLDNLARESERMHRALSTLAIGGGGPWAGLAMTLYPVAVPLLWRLGLVPDTDGMRDLVPPEAIAAGIESGALTPDGRPIPRPAPDDGAADAPDPGAVASALERVRPPADG